MSLGRKNRDIFIGTNRAIALRSRRLRLDRASENSRSNICAGGVHFGSRDLRSVLQMIGTRGSTLRVRANSLSLNGHGLAVRFLSGSPSAITRLVY